MDGFVAVIQCPLKIQDANPHGPYLMEALVKLLDIEMDAKWTSSGSEEWVFRHRIPLSLVVRVENRMCLLFLARGTPIELRCGFSERHDHMA